MSALTTPFGRLHAARGAMAVYVPLRVLTCLLPFMHLIPGLSSNRDGQYGLELAALVLLLTLLTTVPYALVLGSFLSDAHESARTRRSLLLVLTVGALDLASGLAIVAFTDGWSSQFRHYWTAALLVPCLVLGFRWSLTMGVTFIVITYLALSPTGGNWSGSANDLLYLQIGWAVSTIVISGVIGFLGDVVFELQRSRRSAEVARDNLETMLEITRQTAMITSGLNDLMRRVARVIGERHSCQMVGIYVVGSEDEGLRLVGWLGEFEVLRHHVRRGDSLVHEAISSMDARFVQDGRSWNAAIPIRDVDSAMGVLLIGSEGTDTDINRMTRLGHALEGHIAVGIQVARLRQRLGHAATPQEWELITRRIHDRISSSFYSFMMQLETHVEQIRPEGSPLTLRLESIVPTFAQLLIETRHYMYQLLPALRGQIGVDAMVDSMVAEFEKASEIPVRLTIGGSAAHVPIATTVGLYLLLQNRLSDILISPAATKVEVNLRMKSDNLSLRISDNGVENTADRLTRMRELAGDMGGQLEIVPGRDGNTELALDVAMESSGGSLD